MHTAIIKSVLDTPGFDIEDLFSKLPTDTIEKVKAYFEKLGKEPDNDSSESTTEQADLRSEVDNEEEVPKSSASEEDFFSEILKDKDETGIFITGAVLGASIVGGLFLLNKLLD